MEERDDEDKVRHAAPFMMLLLILIFVVIIRWEYIFPSIVNAWNSVFDFSPSVDECNYEPSGCQNDTRWGQ